jgi:Fic family protein
MLEQTKRVKTKIVKVIGQNARHFLRILYRVSVIHLTKPTTYWRILRMTKKKLAYLSTHPWLTFSVDFRKAPVSLWTMLGECHSKCEHIAGVPLRPDVSEKLHAVYLAKGIGGTTAIEGNTLSEAEVLKHVQGKLEVPPSKEYLKQEIDNILQEQNRMLHHVAHGKPLPITIERLRELNRVVLHGLTLDDGVVAGEIRTYSVGVLTYRGAPWQECEYLLGKLCDWLNSPDFEPQHGLNAGHMAILKAVIAHLYIEWIHAFGDGNGRTGRLLEVQILLDSGVPSPACQLPSNHYNQTRRNYLAQLKAASESGGDIIPFIAYALSGFVDGLKEQIEYIKKLQMDVTWVSYVHDTLGHENTNASERQKQLLLDLSLLEEPLDVAKIEQLSAKIAKAYAGMNPRTCLRDIEILEKRKLIIREGKTIRANKALIAQFLPIRAKCQSKVGKAITPETSISFPPPSSQSPVVATTKAV